MWQIRQKHESLLKQETLLFDPDIDYSNNYAIVYPNIYSIGMSNLGLHFLYKYINSSGTGNGERVFLEPGAEHVMSMERNLFLNEFEFILFSLTYELDYLNVIKILKNGNINIFGNERTRLFPLLVGGGAALTINPAPLLGIFDFIFLGNADLGIKQLTGILNKKNYSSKQELWEKLKHVPGVIPGKHIAEYDFKRVKPVDSKPDQPVTSCILTPNTELGNMFLMELARGCPYNCSFCSVNNIYGNYKPYPMDKALNIIRKYSSGLEKVGLVSSAVLEFRGLEQLIETCIESGLTVNTSSLRLEKLNPELLELLKRAGDKTLTLAIESGDRDLRFSCGKSVEDKVIFQKVLQALETGFRVLKFYLIIGMPGETDESMEKTVKFFSELRDSVKSFNPKLTISVNPFIPKPHTPWEKEEFTDRTGIKKRFKILTRGLRKKGYSLKLENPEMAELQYLLANGNHKVLNPVIENPDLTIQQIIKRIKQQ